MFFRAGLTATAVPVGNGMTASKMTAQRIFFVTIYRLLTWQAQLFSPRNSTSVLPPNKAIASAHLRNKTAFFLNLFSTNGFTNA
jgi:hypothetical protein